MVVIAPNSLISRHERQVSCDLDDEAVVMSLDRQEFYALNPTASAVWHLTDAPRRVATIVDDLVGRYDIDRDTCAREVCALLARMAQCGIVQCTGTDATHLEWERS